MITHGHSDEELAAAKALHGALWDLPALKESPKGGLTYQRLVEEFHQLKARKDAEGDGPTHLLRSGVPMTQAELDEWAASTTFP